MTEVPKTKTFMPGGFDMIGRPFLERMSKSNVPAWQKAALYCWSHMAKDGHCQLKEGELAQIVGSTLDARRLRAKVVKKAIAEGWIAPNSTDRCLVAPFDVRYDAGKVTRTSCPFHEV